MMRTLADATVTCEDRAMLRTELALITHRRATLAKTVVCGPWFRDGGKNSAVFRPEDRRTSTIEGPTWPESDRQVHDRVSYLL